MIHLQLTTWERLMLAQWVGQQQGNLRRVRQLLRVLDKLELSEEEKAAVGFIQRGEVQRWEDKERQFAIDLEDAEYEVLRQATAAEWPAQRLVLAMLEKLEAPVVDG